MFCNSISASKKSTFDQCAYKFRMYYSDKIKPKEEANKLVFDFGKFIHKILEDGVDCSSLPQLKEIATNLSATYSILENDLNRTDTCLINFLDFNRQLIGESKTEEYFDIELENGCKLIGYIDRRITSDTNKVLLIDYKTSKREKRTADLLSDDQGKTYVYAINKLYNIPIRDITFAHFYPLTGNFVPVRYSVGAINSFINNLTNTIWKIRKLSNDKAKPKENQFCNWCDYKQICPLFNDPKKIEENKCFYTKKDGTPLNE